MCFACQLMVSADGESALCWASRPLRAAGPAGQSRGELGPGQSPQAAHTQPPPCAVRSLGPLRLAVPATRLPGTVVLAAERRWVWVRAPLSHLELDVFVVDRFHIEADRGDGGHHLTDLQTICKSHAHPTAPTILAPLSACICFHRILLCVCTAQLHPPAARSATRHWDSRGATRCAALRGGCERQSRPRFQISSKRSASVRAPASKCAHQRSQAPPPWGWKCERQR
jgi:hypothetical protein